MTNEIKKTAEALSKVGETFPVYQDLLQPAVQEFGKGLHTLSKTVHIALAPVSAMVWGYEKIADYLQMTLEEKLKDVSLDDIIEPDISIAGPVIENMRFTGDKEELREMFANLLATSMNKEEAFNAHPAYVEIIRQLSSDEAKILKYLKTKYFPIVHVLSYKNNSHSVVLENFTDISYKAGCDLPGKLYSYLDNLSRLGLIKLHENGVLTDKSSYPALENHPTTQHAVLLANSLGKSKITRSHGNTTMFGRQFYNACIKPNENEKANSD